VDLGRTQTEDGAHCLDVCVATTERSDELEFMTNLVKRLSLEVEAPLVVDSTDVNVIRAAIRQIPGRPIINSINLEGDGSRFAGLAPIMAEYGTPAIALCIGPDGMAKTAKQKLDTARLLFESGKKYGLRPEQYIFDVLTFTLATGENEYRRSGIETLNGIKMVKEEFPDSFTVLGLSNISFGLTPQARRILNSVFLYHAIKSGLDAAIVNAREIVPYAEINSTERKLAEDLIYDTSQDALPRLISGFDGTADAKGGSSSGAAPSPNTGMDASWPPSKRANFRIVNRLANGIQDDVVLAIAKEAGLEPHILQDAGGRPSIDAPPKKTHDAAIHVLNTSLLPAMKEVGDKFGAGELILPFVLKSAECMKAAVNELEKYLVKEEGTSKGVLVLGTVYGDVHDIGKNLVKTIFQNNGYTVHDLGKQVPLQHFVEKIREVSPDAVGLSALLVSTSKQMQIFVDYAQTNGINIPVLCGGAAINSGYINRIALQGGSGTIYEPGVFYCNTMFDGLKVMDALTEPSKRPELLAAWKKKIVDWDERQKSRSSTGAAGPADSALQRQPTVQQGSGTPSSKGLLASGIRPVRLGASSSSIVATNLGTPIRLSSEIPMTEVWDLLDKKSLLKLSWGVRGRAGRASEDDHERLFEEWKRRIADEGLFSPQVVYGFFKCRSSGQTLKVEDGRGGTVDFEFPRSGMEGRICLADYFDTAGDIAAFQAVTVGSRVAKITESWYGQDVYADAYYLHGLAVEASEALAEWTNQRIKSEMGIVRGGLRYSWGYASCPDISQHAAVWRLLSPEKSGMRLTESGQIVPDQSTAAIVVHHPDSRYFML